MKQSKISRARRRKLERKAALRDCHALASELGLKLLDVEGVRPEVFDVVVDVLTGIRAALPHDTNSITVGGMPDIGLCIIAVNAPDSLTQ